MKSRRRIIFSIICSIVMMLSVSYAWILSMEPRLARRLSADYSTASGNKLRIAASSDVSMKVLYLDRERGEYIDCDPENLGTLADFSSMVPNDTLNFKLRISNCSDISQKASLSIGGIKNTTEGVSLEDSLVPQMYIDVKPGLGYNAVGTGTIITVPDSLFLRLSDGSLIEDSGEIVLTLYDSLIIPPTGTDPDTGYVELDCYFWLDHNAGSEYQDMTMTIDYFRLVI